MGPVSIGGDVIGNSTEPVSIFARGQAVQGSTTDLAIAKLTVGGKVERANILAGYSLASGAIVASNADAQIGAVKVGGSWTDSNLVAGAQNSNPPNFGDSHDAPIMGGATAIVSKIASITIGGPVYGTPSAVSGTDSFGFVAEQILSVKISGIALALTTGASNDNHLVSVTGDVFVHEIA